MLLPLMVELKTTLPTLDAVTHNQVHLHANTLKRLHLMSLGSVSAPVALRPGLLWLVGSSVWNVMLLSSYSVFVWGRRYANVFHGDVIKESKRRLFMQVLAAVWTRLSDSFYSSVPNSWSASFLFIFP